MSGDSSWNGPLVETFLTVDDIWISDANIVIFDCPWTLLILMIICILVRSAKDEFSARSLLSETEEEPDQ